MDYRSFIKQMMAETGLLRDDCEIAAKVVFGTVRKVLLTGEEVSIPKLGTLYLKVSKAREFTSPATGDTFIKNDRVKLRLRASRKFESILSQQLLDKEQENGQTQA